MTYLMDAKGMTVASSNRNDADIGISIYPDHGTDIDTILKKADSAMYQAKQSGRNQYQLYFEI